MFIRSKFHQPAFLLEIGAEELPARLLEQTIRELSHRLEQEFKQHHISHGDVHTFATPRRLAVLIDKVVLKQEDQALEKKGPNIVNAYDASGKPTPAALGFARSCGVEIHELKEKNGFLVFDQYIKGQVTKALLPKICQDAIAKLAMAKPMRWKDGLQFLRPVRWVVLMLGKETIETNLLGCRTSHISKGHRFLHSKDIILNDAQEYEDKMEKAFVIANFEKRKSKIEKQIKVCADEINAKVLVDESLLDEVTGIVEWPIAFRASFAEEFLKVPAECLISAMQAHQKSFPVINENKKLLPYFISVSNIEGQLEEVIKGNERVMRARLSDAAFFYETDCKQRLENRLESLKSIVFQAKLGTLYDKSLRIAQLAEKIIPSVDTYRAGLLCKADLVSDMVKEFPELQGIMGGYYATHDGESIKVAEAITEHYLPRFANDELPKSEAGVAIAIADRLDTLIGIFGVNQQPTGDKDPFGLRRAALAIVRMIIKYELDLSMDFLLKTAKENYQNELPNKDVCKEVKQFIFDRLHTWYQEKLIAADTLNAVLENEIVSDKLLDIDRRVSAIHLFRSLPAAESLAAANKRASNILSKANYVASTDSWNIINKDLFNDPAEASLFNAMIQIKNSNYKNHDDLLIKLAELRDPLDTFFDNVMVMCDDPNIQKNRLNLLSAFRQLFLQVADISKLQINK